MSFEQSLKCHYEISTVEISSCTGQFGVKLFDVNTCIRLCISFIPSCVFESITKLKIL